MNTESSFVLRPASLADVDAMLAVASAAERHANGVVDVDREDIASEFELPGVDPERHTVVAELGGDVVAWAVLESERGTTYAEVHPGNRGLGIGSAVAAWCERAARDAGLSEVGQTRSDAELDARALLERRGWVPRWSTWMLEVVLSENEPPPPELPDGIRIREFRPGDDDRAVHRLVDDAFGEWEGRGEQTFDEWVGHTIGRETFDPRLSPVALDGDAIVGVAISLAYPDDAEGYVHQLAVRRSHRNRGIGRALLVEAFRGFHRMGRRSVVLSTESRTGALTMYERVGMRVRRSYTRYARDLPRAERPRSAD